LRKTPSIELRKRLVVEVHEKLLHRGVEPTYYNLKQEYYWPSMKETIVNVVRKCKICIENNRKQSGGSRNYIETIVAIDIMKINEEEMNVLVSIDYYTRYLNVAIIENRRTETIISTLHKKGMDGQKKLSLTMEKNFARKDLKICVRNLI
jgi:hypothetical protein